ncbi:hypothetical protein C9J52_14005 [Photobacterium iliopiscarium]|uniref:Prepilin-type N-terminal cleavage/methylation domain-containing protein n=1 Tax=Photobacterium iliopiscarium TaxID=56192 RepID=A0ABX5GPZ4_9GAMM|nr:hypothetical protein C9J52_14005 [Photobacterium iliopiscarium]
MARQQGFTLIELVMVIIVLAIISVTAASRYASKSSFSAELMRHAATTISVYDINNHRFVIWLCDATKFHQLSYDSKRSGHDHPELFSWF